MRLSTITNWAYGVTVVLTFASGMTMLLAADALEDERAAVAQRDLLDQATARIALEEATLSRLARQYAISGHGPDLTAYQRERSVLGTLEDRVRRARDAGAGPDELDALQQAIATLDELQDEQEAAVTARRNGDRNGAIEVLFGPDYERDLERANALFERFQYRLDQRTQSEVAEATRASRVWRTTSEVVLGLTALLFLCVLYFVFRKRVLHPVVKLSDVVARLAAQDYEAVPPSFEQIDEIGDMAQAIRVFRENGLERQRLEEERSADRATRDLLSRMTQRMQASDTLQDLRGVIERFTPEIAPGFAGRLYLLDVRRQAMEEICSWQEPIHSRPEFSPLSCWALRRGVPHRPNGDAIDIPCDHLDLRDHNAMDSICLPLTAQREILGLLYLEQRAGRQDMVRAGASNIYLTILAENIGLAVANLRLRDTLQEMAMADPLTGLANRRRLDTVLGAEFSDFEAQGRPLSCIMLDVDHFKRFNDEFGHDAGDAVLRAVGASLQASSRDGGLAFRVGGEEFLLLLPDVDLAKASERAEDLRRRIAGIRVEFGGRELGPVTASLGVASTPDIAPLDRLVQTTDAALLRAKGTGRNRVVTAEKRQEREVA